MRAEKMKPNVLLSVGLIAIVLSTSTLLVDSLHAEVKCSCPTIDAEGEGETSCSTNESGGKCTIDYNLFANRERRAADLLRNILQTPFTTYAELNTNEALSQAYERDELTNQVLLYLLIAAVDQYSSHQDTVPDNVFSDVQSIVEEYQYSIEEAFHPSYFHRFLQMSEWELEDPDDHIIVNDGIVVITFGCMSIRTRDAEVMFKTWWSPARALPQCALYY